jgi:ribosome recycling factor
MHKTPASERRKSLIRDAKELAKDARFLERTARAPAARKEAQRLPRRGEFSLGAGRSSQAPIQARGLDCMRGGEGQTDPEGP